MNDKAKIELLLNTLKEVKEYFTECAPLDVGKLTVILMKIDKGIILGGQDENL